MRTTTKIASVLAVVMGMSFVLAGEAQAGCKRRGYRYVSRPYLVVRSCRDYHFGFCKYYKRYGYCRYYVPAPVGGPPVLGTIPAPAPGSPAVVQPAEQVVAATPQSSTVVVTAQTTAQAAQTGTADSTTTASPSIDEAQLAAIVAAVQSVLEQPKQDELPKIDPGMLKALEQLIDQKMAEATKATETEAASLPEIEPTAQESESESNDSTLESLRAMIAQLMAQ